MEKNNIIFVSFFVIHHSIPKGNDLQRKPLNQLVLEIHFRHDWKKSAMFPAVVFLMGRCSNKITCQM